MYMGSDQCETSSRPTVVPKLCLYSTKFPIKSEKEASSSTGITTPPIHTSSVSVPFQWEEAPGKPRPCTATTNQNQSTKAINSSAIRGLELPPRLTLLSEPNKVANYYMPSPTTVLDGPDHSSSGRFVTSSYTLSFRKDGSFRWVNNNNYKDKVMFGSSRWGSSFRKAAGAEGGVVHDAQVKITSRVRRKGSLLSLSQPRSHVLASIYESFKQVVPWRRGQEKMKKKGSWI